MLETLRVQLVCYNYIMSTGNTAKTVVLSSIITTIVLLGILFSLSDYVTQHIAAVVEERVTLILPAPLAADHKTISAIKAANPAVVSVVVTKDVPIYEQYYESFNPFGFFGGFQVPRVRENGTEEKEVGGGSGFIVSADGLIVTNRHVVSDTDARYSILLNEGASHQVEVLARDTQLDIAVLRVVSEESVNLPYVTFADSDKLQLGQSVIAIGNALAEFRNSVSVGVVSGLARSIVASDGLGNSEVLEEVIQTDAAINPGNSGGPLLNTDGKVVGVNVATSRGAENISFAIPADLVENVVASVQKYGEIVRPHIGVYYTMLTEQISNANSLPVDYGAWVVRSGGGGEAVLPNSPASMYGLENGDIITTIDNMKLQNKSLAAELRNHAVGQTVNLTVIRGEEELQIKLELGKME